MGHIGKALEKGYLGHGGLHAGLMATAVKRGVWCPVLPTVCCHAHLQMFSACHCCP